MVIVVLGLAAGLVAEDDTAAWVVWTGGNHFSIASIVTSSHEDFSDLTQEVLPLFEYIQTTQRTEHPLTLAGFDTQISSTRGVADRPAFLRRILATIDTHYADQVKAFDRTFINQTRTNPAAWDEAEAFYDLLDRFFAEHGDELAEAVPDGPQLIQMQEPEIRGCFNRW